MSTPHVLCEELIIVEDPTAPEWWLSPEVTEGSPVYEGGGRVRAAHENKVIDVVAGARERGFNPIVLCPSAAVRKRLGARFRERRSAVQFLVLGYDHKQIRNLLTHPSCEVLLGWCGKRSLVLPTEEYGQALSEWLDHDLTARRFLARVEHAVLRMEDFSLISEPDAASKTSPQIYQFQWKFDSLRKVSLYFYLDGHSPVLVQTLNDKTARAKLQLGEKMLTFDADGECKLDRMSADWLVDHFGLPQKCQPGSMHDETRNDGESTPTLKVLMVDDHALFRDGLALLLKQLDSNIEPIHAPGFQDALKALATGPQDLVLLDLGLPDTPGIEGITLLKQKYPDTPIVVLSGTSDRETVLQAIKKGAMGFIPKTHSADLLHSALRLILVHKGVYLPPELFQEPHEDTKQGKVTVPAALGLTSKQAEVLYCILQGKSNKAIARSLGVEEPTIRAHLSPVLRSLNVTTRTDAVVRANKIGLVFSDIPSNVAKR